MPLLAFMALQSQATPFDDCSSKAFLFQNSTPDIYAVDLASGAYELVAKDISIKGVNGIGYNVNDNYIYGWDYVNGAPMRIGKDHTLQPLPFANSAAVDNHNFYVGDVSLANNTYYVYRRGSGAGLYAIPLDNAGSSPLTASKVIDGSVMDLRIYDMAFNPLDSFAYSVDYNGQLIQINAGNGASTVLGNVGQTGTFGAVYFDGDGRLYISRNQDGKIFQINIAQSVEAFNASSDFPAAVYFAQGPKSGQNDGARCATSTVIDEKSEAFDFGDAPDSYGTTVINNGARHDITGEKLFLGKLVDGESTALQDPETDDSDNQDDEDGISFVTGFEIDLDTMLVANASADGGYLNAWADWDQDGVFSEDERVFSDRELVQGSNRLKLRVPVAASFGETWMRFRLSSETGLLPTGFASDGEVEDYKIDVIGEGVSTTYYPSRSGWVTFAYEDNWPLLGDFDLNDTVFYARTTTYARKGELFGVRVEGEAAAIGASYHNGFAIKLPGLSRSDVDESEIKFSIDGEERDGPASLEGGRTEAILVITDDLKKHITPDEEDTCKFYRTEVGCDNPIQFTFDISAQIFSGIKVEDGPSAAFDPFLFATPNQNHGTIFDSEPGRALEIHMKNVAPTSAFNSDYFSFAAHDVSDARAGLYYLSSNGMPFALEVGTRWQYPKEYTDIQLAYPKFAEFSTSAGAAQPDWYLLENARTDLIYR